MTRSQATASNSICTVRGWMATLYYSIHLELNMFNNTRHATQRWLPTTHKPQCFAVYNIRIHEVLIREHYSILIIEFKLVHSSRVYPLHVLDRQLLSCALLTIIHMVVIRYDEGLTLETSAF